MAVFWDAAPCSSLDIGPHLEKACRPHYQDDSTTLMMETVYSSETSDNSISFHDATSQKTVIFIVDDNILVQYKYEYMRWIVLAGSFHSQH
jgi:hypothetical protein